MPVRRSRGGRKRGFKTYASAKQAGWDKPGGGGFPGDPFERTMKRVKLTANFEPFGMNETRKQKLRRMLWYWQWSRDWNWRQIAAVADIQPDQHNGVSTDLERYVTGSGAATSWYWRWPKKRKRHLKKLVNKRTSELMAWMVSLNLRQNRKSMAVH